MINKRRISLLFFIVIILVPLLIFGAVHWYQRNVCELPYYGEKYAVENANPYFKVPDFRFTNQDSMTTNQSFIKNKVWVANFFFTSCPSICPQMTRNLTTVQAAFSKDDNVRIVSFSVDPEHDSPNKLKRYAQRYGINAAQWQLLTGNKKDLYQFARKGLSVVATDGDGGAGDFIHSDNLVLIDKEGHIRGYYDGTSRSEVKKLITDIKKLQ